MAGLIFQTTRNSRPGSTISYNDSAEAYLVEVQGLGGDSKMDIVGLRYKDSEKLVNGPGENLTREEWEKMLKNNTAAVKAVDKAWPKELWQDAMFKAYGSRYGAFPFYVPLRWCQSLLKILLAGFAEGVRRKNRKSVD